MFVIIFKRKEMCIFSSKVKNWKGNIYQQFLELYGTFNQLKSLNFFTLILFLCPKPFSAAVSGNEQPICFMLPVSVAEQKDESSPSHESLRFDMLYAELALTAL